MCLCICLCLCHCFFLARLCVLITLIKCLKGHMSLRSLFVCQSVKYCEWVTEWVTRSPIELFWTAKKELCFKLKFCPGKVFKLLFQLQIVQYRKWLRPGWLSKCEVPPVVGLPRQLSESEVPRVVPVWPQRWPKSLCNICTSPFLSLF